MKEKYKEIKICFFVVPDFSAFISGGNIYNESLITALQALGYPCQTITFSKFEISFQKEEAALFFIDSLFLTEVAALLSLPRNGSEIWLLVHHLTSLYPPPDTNSLDYFKTNEAPLLKLFDGFLTSSQFTADYLHQKRGLVQQTIVVPPAIKYLPPTIVDKSADTINALIVANLVERKGILPFLEALSSIEWTPWEEQLTIEIIGSEMMSPSYVKACHLVLDQHPELASIVHLNGVVPEEEMPAYYEWSNLFISTAYMETYGMALQEARYFQLPILAVNGGNVATHIEEEKNGFLLTNPTLVALQLKQLCEYRTLLKNLLVNAKYKAITDEVYTWENAAVLLAQQIN